MNCKKKGGMVSKACGSSRMKFAEGGAAKIRLGEATAKGKQCGTSTKKH